MSNTNLKTNEKKLSVKKKKVNYYFGQREEDAVITYLTTDDHEEKNRIFDEILYPAFTKMIESIIKRYRLFTPGEEFEDTFCDAMSNLINKLDEFDPTKGNKAYSYYGTICKNYLIHKRRNAQKEQKINSSYEVMFENRSPNIIYDEYTDHIINSDLIELMATKIEECMNEPNKHNLNDNDIKVGICLIVIFRDWDKIFNFGDTKKFNKSSVIYFIREQTHLKTTEIRRSLKKYSDVYYKTKEQFL